jgi:hypothetical protein
MKEEKKLHANSAHLRVTHVRCPNCGVDVIVRPALTATKVKEMLAQRTGIPVDKLNVTKGIGIALLEAIDRIEKKVSSGEPESEHAVVTPIASIDGNEES